jgi:circadian clock protein KaiB
MTPRKTYILKLYVAGNTPNSMRALKTLRNILETEFRGVYALKVIDVLKNPQLAEEDKILATPTLAKILPPPVRRIIGDLSDRERVLIGLDLLYEELTEEALGDDADAEDDGAGTAPLDGAQFDGAQFGGGLEEAASAPTDPLPSQPPLP